MVAHYAADNVMFVLAPPLQYTPENTPGKKGMEEWFATFRGPLGHEVRDLEVTAAEDLGFSHSLNHLLATQTDGKKSDLWFRQTLCFRKLGGEWKIAHQHESVPYYMDGSARGAIDLKP